MTENEQSEWRAGFEMTRAVAALGKALRHTKATDKQAYLAEIARLASTAKKVRNALYRDQTIGRDV